MGNDYGTNGLSASDVALLTGRNGNNGGWGDSGAGAWWLIILLLALGGWGGRGFGGFGGGNDGGTTFVPYNVGGFGGFGGSCGLNPYDSIQRQLDQGFTNLNTDINQVNNNVTQGFYNTATNMLTGFANTNMALANGFSATQRQLCDSTASINANVNNNGYETRLLGVNMNSALQNCCCDVKTGIADLKYTVATENCADRQALNEGIRDVIASNTANTQAILNKLSQQELDAKNEVIANLRTQLNMADLRASQTAQTADLRASQATVANQLVSELRSCPIPSQPVYRKSADFHVQPILGKWRLWMQ